MSTLRQLVHPMRYRSSAARPPGSPVLSSPHLLDPVLFVVPSSRPRPPNVVHPWAAAVSPRRGTWPAARTSPRCNGRARALSCRARARARARSALADLLLDTPESAIVQYDTSGW